MAALLGCAGAAGGQTLPASVADELPDAPSARLSQTMGTDGQSQMVAADEGERPEAGEMEKAPALRPCKDRDYVMDKVPLQGPPPCMPENPISPYVTSLHIQPLSSQQKGELAWKDFRDPFNFVTIAGYSAIAVAENPHTAYGAGFKGFGKLTGYGIVEDAQGEFFQTYVIPSLVHEDPRYHRMPTASVKRRIWHAIEHTYVSQHDDGRPMPNYATLGTYVISAELSNLYVPGLPTNVPSTARRIAVGIATDPSGAIVAEFLPDIARHVHFHITFIQNIVNTMVTGAPSVTAQ